MSRRVGNGEPPLRRAIHQVGGGMGQVLQIGLDPILLHHPRRAAIAILANQPVDVRLFAETFQPRRNDQKLAAIGQGHPRAIDRLVGHPGAEELVGLHHANHFLDRLVEDGDVLLARMPGRRQIGLQIVADVQARVDETICLVASHDDLHIDVGQMLQIALFGQIEDRAQRRQQVAKVVFDAAAGGHDVRRANRRLAGQSDEVVLVVVGKSKHFVRHDYSRR